MQRKGISSIQPLSVHSLQVALSRRISIPVSFRARATSIAATSGHLLRSASVQSGPRKNYPTLHVIIYEDGNHVGKVRIIMS